MPDTNIPSPEEIIEEEPTEVAEVTAETEQLPKWHRRHGYKIILGLLALISLSLWWYRRPVAEVTKQIKVQTPKTQPVGGRIRKITPSGNLTPAGARYSVEEFDFTYTSVDARNQQEIEVTARAYLPVGAGAQPLIAFGPGTTGPGPACAPTLERNSGKNWGSYDSVLSFYAGQGYPVAMTDYANRNGVISPYFVGESEARVMLDLVRAMQIFRADPDFRGSVVSDQVFLAGYSQGGHAALWAEKLRPKYAPEIKIAGLILFAPATDMQRTFADSAKGATTVWLPPYVVAAYKDYYGQTTDPQAIFTPRYSPTLDADAAKYCINDVEPFASSGIEYFGTPSSLDALYQPNFLAAMRAGSINSVAPDLGHQLDQNLAGEPEDVPVLMVSGRKDQVILVGAQTDLAHRICKGNQSNLQWALSDANHYSSMFSAGKGPVLNWLGQLTSGQTPASECSSYAS